MTLPVSVNGQQTPTALSSAETTPVWSLVYLPSIGWTEKEIGQTVKLLGQVKPELVVSLAACPFAGAIRSLECKPEVLDSTRRLLEGKECDVPPEPWSAYAGTSTLHPIGGGNGAKSQLVWLSAEAVKQTSHGPIAGEEELRSLAIRQVRKQFAERHGDVVLLVDSSVPTPPEESWILPATNVRYEQPACAVTGVVCIRPETLRTHLDPVWRITPRMPLVHWIHSEKGVTSWEVLPIDGGPAIQRLVSSDTPPRGGNSKTAWLKGPASSTDVPKWLDDYINNNPALGCGENIRPLPGRRRFGWAETAVSRDSFDVLGAINHGAEVKTKVSDLARGAVRSPGNLFSVTVGQLDEKGVYSEEGDDGINVYLDDLRGGRSRLLYFAGLYSAWPSAATWFTDRYVITAGTSRWVDPPEDSDGGPRFHPLTIRVFDLLAGRSYAASGMPQSSRAARPTEEIIFPEGSYEQGSRWRRLWNAVEASYLASPEVAPVKVEAAATTANLSVESGVNWSDLGVWPPPENWQLVLDSEKVSQTYPPPKMIPTGDPFLTCQQTAGGELHYSLNIVGDAESADLEDTALEKNLLARAELLIAGGGSLPKVESIQRTGHDKQCLLIAGSFRRPGPESVANGKWMLLLDLLRHRAWSVHW